MMGGFCPLPCATCHVISNDMDETNNENIMPLLTLKIMLVTCYSQLYIIYICLSG